MIFVCGVSASGKSSLIRAFTAVSRQFNHVKASELLQKAGHPIRNLSWAIAEQNQHALLAILQSEGLVASSSILDGHVTIETIDAPYIVPNWFFRGATVAGIVCVINDVATIKLRRSKRPNNASTDVETFQEEEQRSARARALELGIPYFAVNANDQSHFAVAVHEISRAM